MSNSQARTAFRQRRKTRPGPHDGTSSYELPAFQLGKRAMNLLILRQVTMEQERRDLNGKLLVPRSGPGRRRAKAHRNAGLCLHPGGGRELCRKPAVADGVCEWHQPEVEVEVELTDA